MKKIIRTSLRVFLLAIMIINISCEKLDVVKVTKIQTGDYSNITNTSAVMTGLIIDVSEDARDIGHCWDTISNPDINSTKDRSQNGYNQGEEILTNLTNLLPSYTYYVRAYAITDNGEIYGNETYFTTLGENSINITSPGLGADWQLGSTQTITWTDNIDESVRIELMQGQNMVSLITGDTQSNGSFTWVIPLAEFLAGEYYIQITSVATTDITGTSEIFIISAATGTTGEVTDIDNNTYQTVKIGGQWWMAENFKGNTL